MNLPRSKLDRAFYLTLGVKAADGVLQLLAGLALLFVKPSQIGSRLGFFTERSFDSDTDDVIFRGISHYLSHLNGGNLKFAAIYLIADAVIKLILINEIFHKRYWAYIGLIVVLSALAIFQTYKIIYTHSVVLTVLTLFDLLVIYLSAKEYNRHQRSIEKTQPQ